MNRKLILKNKWNELIYCVLDPSKDFAEQLEEVFLTKRGMGYSVSLETERVLIRDYFHGENAGEFEIIAWEYTSEDVSLCLNKIKEETSKTKKSNKK